MPLIPGLAGRFMNPQPQTNAPVPIEPPPVIPPFNVGAPIWGAPAWSAPIMAPPSPAILPDPVTGQEMAPIQMPQRPTKSKPISSPTPDQLVGTWEYDKGADINRFINPVDDRMTMAAQLDKTGKPVGGYISQLPMQQGAPSSASILGTGKMDTDRTQALQQASPGSKGELNQMPYKYMVGPDGTAFGMEPGLDTQTYLAAKYPGAKEFDPYQAQLEDQAKQAAQLQGTLALQKLQGIQAAGGEEAYAAKQQAATLSNKRAMIQNEIKVAQDKLAMDIAELERRQDIDPKKRADDIANLQRKFNQEYQLLVALVDPQAAGGLAALQKSSY